MSQIEEILLPDVGGEEVEIIEICVSIGENLEEEDAIITVETDKASMDIPAIFAGSIVELKVAVGDKISEGTVLCTMSKAGAEAPAAVETKAEVETPAPVVESKVETPAASQSAQQVTTVIEDVYVPDIGEDGEVEVIEVLVSIGDSISEEDGLLTLETDKATMDVPAPFDGIIKEFFIEVGAKVKTGTLVARIEKTIVVDIKVASKASVPAPAKVETASVAKTVAAPIAVIAVNEPSNIKTSAHASPSIRRLAREFGVDLNKVDASGRKNRILKDDVKAYVKKALANPSTTAPAATGSGFGFNLPALRAVDFSKFGETEVLELTKIQKISGPSLHRNYVSMPHVTQFDEADITSLESFRKDQNALALKRKLEIKISPLIFILKAVAKALELHPKFNSSLSEDQQTIILKKYINIAVAVDTPNGLVVPVIKDVNKKGIHELAAELAVISKKARDGKLKITDMQGACFTISSLGGIGGTAFTPIINAPEVGILGVSKSSMKPVWNGSEFEPKLMLPLSLSYDHRVIDGAYGARFTATIANILGDIRLLSI